VNVLTRTLPAGRNPPVPVLDEINSAILGCAADFVKRRKTSLPDDAARKKAWQNSRFYYYVSGHGMDGDGDDAVLITANAIPESLNHISTRNVLNRLKMGKVFAELVILADCCRDLAAVTVMDLPWDLRNLGGFNDPMLPRVFVAKASRNRKKAFEPLPGAAFQTSIFTQALLEGLQGGVSGTEVNSTNLSNFLFNYVPRLAAQFSTQEQNPEIQADPDIVFVQTSKDYQVILTAGPGSPIAALPEVEALAMGPTHVQRRTALPATANGVFSGRLPTGYYAIVASGGEPGTGSPLLCVLGEDTNANIG
jgi:hypothetical protein